MAAETDPDVIANLDAAIAGIQAKLDLREALSVTARANLAALVDAIQTRQAQAGVVQQNIAALEGPTAVALRRAKRRLERLKAGTGVED